MNPWEIVWAILAGIATTSFIALGLVVLLFRGAHNLEHAHHLDEEENGEWT